MADDNHGTVASSDLLHVFPSAGKSRIFVNPGKDVLELLMRTVFKDDREATAAVMLFSKCQKYGFQRGLGDLKAWLAAKCSVQGRSTAMALMAETGVVAPSVLQASGNKMMKRGVKNERNSQEQSE